MVVRNLFAVAEADAMGGGIDGGNALAGTQGDVAGFEERLRTKQQPVLASLAQVCLRQRRTLIRQARFLADQHHRAFMALLAQADRGLTTALPGTHDHNAFLHQWTSRTDLGGMCGQPCGDICRPFPRRGQAPRNPLPAAF